MGAALSSRLSVRDFGANAIMLALAGQKPMRIDPANLDELQEGPAGHLHTGLEILPGRSRNPHRCG